ncbi:MAG: DNA alkylation repair protein [Candidatus Izimaplasma sp.]|nr:DNA alkylation repair protein [Candidatus Izimaplasma bacterium]
MILDELNKLKENSEITNITKYHKKNYIENEVDYFLKIDTPTLRNIAKTNYKNITEKELVKLITNKIHEYRTVALMILTYRNKTPDLKIIEENYKTYTKYIDYVNNWDLVDISAPNIVGKYVYLTKYKNILYELAYSNKLWQERIAIVSNLYLIKKGELTLPIKIISILLEHNHDLIHKANGWMLREIGKQNIGLLNNFIKENYNSFPRTTLRYAIEKHNETERKRILKGDFKWMQK